MGAATAARDGAEPAPEGHADRGHEEHRYQAAGQGGSGAVGPVRAASGRCRWPCRAAANSAAVANRSAGSFASAVRTASSTSSGTVSRTVESAVARSVITLATMACAVLPVKGGSPASIS